MSNILKTWEAEKLHFQTRYTAFYRKAQANPSDLDAIAHLHECSYVLIRVFGLTPAQVLELEH